MVMTAYSELFVTETVRDAVQEILNRRYPNKYPEINIAVPPFWEDIWNTEEYEDTGDAPILDKDDKEIGRVTWKTSGKNSYETVVPVDLRVTIKGEPEPELKKWKTTFKEVVILAETEEEAHETALGIIRDGEVKLNKIWRRTK